MLLFKIFKQTSLTMALQIHTNNQQKQQPNITFIPNKMKQQKNNNDGHLLMVLFRKIQNSIFSSQQFQCFYPAYDSSYVVQSQKLGKFQNTTQFIHFSETGKQLKKVIIKDQNFDVAFLGDSKILALSFDDDQSSFTLDIINLKQNKESKFSGQATFTEISLMTFEKSQTWVVCLFSEKKSSFECKTIDLKMMFFKQDSTENKIVMVNSQQKTLTIKQSSKKLSVFKMNEESMIGIIVQENLAVSYQVDMFLYSVQGNTNHFHFYQNFGNQKNKKFNIIDAWEIKKDSIYLNFEISGGNEISNSQYIISNANSCYELRVPFFANPKNHFVQFSDSIRTLKKNSFLKNSLKSKCTLQKSENILISYVDPQTEKCLFQNLDEKFRSSISYSTMNSENQYIVKNGALHLKTVCLYSSKTLFSFLIEEFIEGCDYDLISQVTSLLL